MRRRSSPARRRSTCATRRARRRPGRARAVRRPRDHDVPPLRPADAILFLVTGATRPRRSPRLRGDARPGDAREPHPRRRADVAILDRAAAAADGPLTAPSTFERWPTQTAVQDTLTIDRPEQLKALGHPLRLQRPQALGEHDRVADEPRPRAAARRRPRPPALPRAHAPQGGADRARRRRPAPREAVPVRRRTIRRRAGTHVRRPRRRPARGDARRGASALLGVRRRADFRAAQLNVRLDREVIRGLFEQELLRRGRLKDQSEDPITVTVMVSPIRAGARRLSGARCRGGTWHKRPRPVARLASRNCDVRREAGRFEPPFPRREAVPTGSMRRGSGGPGL